MDSSTSTEVAGLSPDQGKLFVGGISPDTSEAALAEHFGEYGEVKDVVVIRDRLTGNGRGFGFVQFVDFDVAERVLKVERHVIDERRVEVKRALMRRYHNNAHQQQNQGTRSYREHDRINTTNDSYGGGEVNPKKIFVGGLPDSLTQDEFRRYFENFGRVTDTVVMYDNATHRPRGFGFVTFDSEEVVQNVMKNSKHELNGKFIDVKIALPKDGTNHRNYEQNGYNSQAFGVKGQDLPVFQGVIYPQYSNRYGLQPAAYSPYLYGGYGNLGYGYGPPAASSRYPWSIPYGNAPFYFTYANDRVGNNMRMASGGHAQGAVSVNSEENQPASSVPAADGAPSPPEVSLDA